MTTVLIWPSLKIILPSPHISKFKNEDMHGFSSGMSALTPFWNGSISINFLRIQGGLAYTQVFTTYQAGCFQLSGRKRVLDHLSEPHLWPWELDKVVSFFLFNHFLCLFLFVCCCFVLN